MGIKYEWDVNPIRDFFMGSLMYDVDISEKKLNLEVHSNLCDIIGDYLQDESELVYLDFIITNDDGFFNIVGKNMITALWLSGIFVKDLSVVSKNSVLLIGDREYEFDETNYKLNYKNRDE